MNPLKRLSAGILAAVFLCASLALATGCSTTPTTPSPTVTAPGYQNAADQQMGEILAGAHAFYLSVQQQSAAGTLTLSATAKLAFNDFGISLNAADQVYLDYHANPTAATEAMAATAVNAVQVKQAALPVVTP